MDPGESFGDAHEIRATHASRAKIVRGGFARVPERLALFPFPDLLELGAET